MTAPAAAPAATDLAALARLAGGIADPLSYFHPSHFPDLGLAASDLAALDRHPAFRGPLRAALAGALSPAAGLPYAALAAPEKEERLVDRLVLLSGAALDSLSLDLAALVLHRRIALVLTGAAQQALRAEIGEAAHQLARQEAPLVFSAFSALDRPRSLTADLSALRRRDFLLLGSGVALAVARLADPGRAALLALRLPKEAEDHAARLAVAPRHVALTERLLERRGLA